MKLARLIDPKFKSSLALLNEQKLPLKAAFKLKVLIKKVNEELEKYEQVRVAALNSFGKKNEDGSLASDANGNVVLDGEGATAFINELNELLSLDIDLPAISVSDLGENITISSEDLFLLDFIVE